jgi:membrane complex biogenesis BtpA family protein
MIGFCTGSLTGTEVSVSSYADRLAQGKDLIAMIHLDAMPATPRSRSCPREIVARAVEEAKLYQDQKIQTVMIENMHDVPYIQQAGPEVVATMALAGRAIKDLGLFCGIQILAGCNREALGAAHAAGLDFIRAEGYVFGHVADEGFFEACAGDLLRYRSAIGADAVLVFTDIKKKHSSHAITADVDIVETAKAASFFLSDGIVVTGASTGAIASVDELRALAPLSIRKLIGSGITSENLSSYFDLADAFIVGSSLKEGGGWAGRPDRERVARMVRAFRALGGNL